MRRRGAGLQFGFLLGHFAGYCPCQRTLATSAKGVSGLETTRLSTDPRRLENLWRDFFSDPSQWWDHRADKASVKYPDFTHKRTQQALWLDNRRNPRWLKPELAALYPGALNANPFSWNKKLATFVKDGQYGKTLDLFREMERDGIVPDTFTFVQVLHACASMQDLEEGRRIHGLIIQNGCELDVFVGSGLINMYSKCGSPDEGRVVFDKMPVRNVVVWNAMIQGYGTCRQADKALELSSQMARERIEPDKVTFAAILTACIGMAALEEGRRIHASIIDRSLESDVKVGTGLVVMYAKCGSMEDAHQVFNKLEARHVVAWNNMIMGYVKSGQGHTALGVFYQMQVETVEPDTFTFLGVLNACASIGFLEEGRRIHAMVVDKGLESDVSVGNALIDMYSKCGNIQEATGVFNKMLSFNVVSFTAMLGGYAGHGKAKEALMLFEQMCQQRIEMNWTTFFCLLCACSHAGLVEKGTQYFQSMVSNYGILPRAEHYVCMVDLLGRVGRLDEAEELLKKMSCEPNVHVWNALHRACRVHDNVHMGERATRKIRALDLKNVSGYVMLSNVYAAANNWDKVRQVKKEKGVKKQPGFTWIVVNDNVHSFVVDDQTHPQINDIHAELTVLSEKMKTAGYVPDTSSMLRDVEEEEMLSPLGHYSEKLAIGLGLISTPPRTPIRVSLNFRVCVDSHTATKFISRIVRRQIILRDANRFHYFEDGVCSCKDYW
ncbi:unnamed protein product [Calypogeia fissa]